MAVTARTADCPLAAPQTGTAPTAEASKADKARAFRCRVRASCCRMDSTSAYSGETLGGGEGGGGTAVSDKASACAGKKGPEVSKVAESRRAMALAAVGCADDGELSGAEVGGGVSLRVGWAAEGLT